MCDHEYNHDSGAIADAMLAKAREQLEGAALRNEGAALAWKIDWPDEPELGHYFGEEPNPLARSIPLYAMSWMPIDTAPKDGTKIILGKIGMTSIGQWLQEEGYIRERRDLDGRYVDQDEFDGFDGWMDWEGGIQDWTHWMPIPTFDAGA